nr:LOW QUALITY PROTEIN: indolethylamine N-methyltransferase-like [Equus asinus]
MCARLCPTLQLSLTCTPGGMGGDILINIGPGPTIYLLLSACEAFQEVMATDYTEQNLQELEKWLRKEPGADDWSPAMQYVCELEGNRSPKQVAEKEAWLGRTVTRWLKGTVTQPDPLGPAQVPSANCVLSLLALESACPHVDTHWAAGWSLASLLKPGGHLVTMAALRSWPYMLGSEKFFGLCLGKQTVERAMQEASCQVLRCHYHPISYSEAYSSSEVTGRGPGA